MKSHSSASRRAFGLITPIAVPLLLIFFYPPFIAAPLRAHGWTRGGALAAGFAIALGWFVLGAGILFIVPERFAKLESALEVGVLVIPLWGMLALMLWDLLRFLIHSAR